MVNNEASGFASNMDKMRADYDMSRGSRYERNRIGLAPQGNSADWHYRFEAQYYRDVEKARDLQRNDACVGQITDRAVSNIVQDGFQVNPNTGDTFLDADLKAMWTEWQNDPDEVDIAGEFNFHDFEIQAMHSTLVDGDFIALALNSGNLQGLEAHNVQTTTQVENTVLGVTKDPFNKRINYWIRPDAIDPSKARVEQSIPVPVRNDDGLRTLFHVYNPKRVSQTRGVTAFAPIFSMTSMLDDTLFAALVKQQVTSCFTVFRERTDGLNAPHDPNYGMGVSESQAGGGVRQLDGVAPGMEILGNPGEKLHGFSPSVPGSDFFPHVNLTLTLIGVNLGLPLCLVLMDGSQTNFSGWRGAIDEARKGWAANQKMLMQRFHRPVWKWKVAQWIANDPAMKGAASRDGVNINRHDWVAPAWKYIEPLKDAQADALMISSGLTSPRRLHASRGKDWDVVCNEIVEDNLQAITKAKEAAEKLNEQFDGDKQPVHWRELINMPLPDGVQMQMMDSAPGEEESGEESTTTPKEDKDA